ncbi:MAG TPA: Ku protein [Candidatus Binatia bacterium]|jgi:DNA end-binding protein Ku|nr:Ku protein [Candidatus Binatia bacterium]
MPARSIGSATVSFGLVSIPVRLYVATHSEQPSFNQIHQECGSRIKQQIFCPRCDRVVERRELVKGREVGKEQYVLFTDDELKALEVAASQSIDIHEFVPLAAVDPVYFENTHYLGPDKGGDKAYQLLAEAMRETAMVALAQHVTRGKEHLVLIRPLRDGLALHTLYYADEVRAFDEVDRGATVTVKPGEAQLARKLIEQLTTDGFNPEQYRDHYRDRLQQVIDQKLAGDVVVAPDVPAPRGQVIDLMEALKQSLAREGGRRTASEPAAEAADVPKRRAAGGGGDGARPRGGGKKK